jgi:hypothetical protein
MLCRHGNPAYQRPKGYTAFPPGWCDKAVKPKRNQLAASSFQVSAPIWLFRMMKIGFGKSNADLLA